MPIAGSGPVSFSTIASLVKGSSSAQTSLNESLVRYLAGVESGAISVSNFRNKPASGSTTYNTPGTYTFICPAYETLSVDVRGAGGGGAGGGAIAVLIPINGDPGIVGGNSSFGSATSVIAGGGGGGNGSCYSGLAGTNGTGSGGVDQGAGGGSGGAGGLGALLEATRYCSGLAGGIGNRQTKSWTFATTSGYVVWGSSYTVVVGQGGAGGDGKFGITGSGANGLAGANGSVTISWS